MSSHAGYGNDMDEDDDDDVRREQMEYDEDNPREENISDVGEGDGEINDGEENEGADGAAAAKPPKAKRVIKNPQPKLNCQRLKTSRGLSALPGHFSDFKFNGKGHEIHDLSRVLRRLEHWAHRLYPRLRFEDFVEQMERLGKKQDCKVLLKRIRLDMHEPEDDAELLGDEDAPVNVDEPANMFDDLMGDSGPPNPPSSPPHAPPPPPRQQETLTEEQIERIERNRLLAMEKRKARLLEQQTSTLADS